MSLLAISLIFLILSISVYTNSDEEESETSMIKIIEPIGPCINSQCPRRHICRNEKCYPNSLKAETYRSQRKLESIGPCIGGLCPKNYECFEDDQCYTVPEE
ncbi:unnamed protein product [Dracunculus medinensis]|uniref:CC domain-containing protein n=1 Tax=Dracunculus medinensis TaxID=318479 RepID=A0A0N4UP93_DRAME|nr:unnamed protein product [Dracunculus medinensis]